MLIAYIYTKLCFLLPRKMLATAMENTALYNSKIQIQNIQRRKKSLNHSRSFRELSHPSSRMNGIPWLWPNLYLHKFQFIDIANLRVTVHTEVRKYSGTVCYTCVEQGEQGGSQIWDICSHLTEPFVLRDLSSSPPDRFSNFRKVWGLIVVLWFDLGWFGDEVIVVCCFMMSNMGVVW